MRNRTATALATFVLTSGAAWAQTPEVKTAEQVYKNIVQLKGTPADQLTPSMQFITASLGVECSTCHVEGKPEADDKPAKKTARAMIAMTLNINKEQRGVTCYTCHRGAENPVNAPPVADSDPTPPAARPAPTPPAQVTADDIVAKYTAAVGGADALKKITSREMKGSVTAMGNESPIELYLKAPNKRVSVSHAGNSASFTAFDGTAGWMGNTGRPARDMSTYSSFASGLDAEMYLPLRLKELFPQLRASGRLQDVNGSKCVTLSGQKPGVGQATFYFDVNSGLLMRMVRSETTPLGRNLTQIDYADYRDADGVKIPFRWTLARPGNRFTIQLKEVKSNGAIDDSKFAKPAGDVK